MKPMRHPWRHVTGAERRAIWRKWRAGVGYTELARLLGRSRSTVWSLVNPQRPKPGASRRSRTRNPRHLTATEREAISRGLAQGLSVRAIARALARAASTISREITRNAGRARYRAGAAERRAVRAAARPKPCKLGQAWNLRQVVAAKLRRRWSPQQIAGWLQQQNPQDMAMQVSHETIYRTLFIQTRGVLKQELRAYLRAQRKPRTPGGRGETRGQIVGAVSIRERPAEVADRAVPGHWEGDLLVGTNGSYLATLVERTSRFVMRVKLESKQSAAVVAALSKRMRRLPAELRRSLTWDRGQELSQHAAFTVATDLKVYFCDPHSPWQRGSNENTNGLLRQYFPKGQSLSHHSQADLNRIARELNERPRQTLGFRTPLETLKGSVAMTR